MNIGLFGYGTVGSGVDELVENRKCGKVKKVLSRTVKDAFRGRAVSDISEIISDPEIDTVCECMGGLHPAFDYITVAMKAGKNVVTSNKAVLAAYFRELTELTRETGVSFRATASVGGGIPWLTTLEQLLKSEDLIALSGIMNGTTNFILSKMEENLKKRENADFSKILKEAQALGYAERDPSADIDGIDARRKLAISMNVGFGGVFDENEIPAFGIRSIEPADFEAAFQMGRTIRLMACGAILPKESEAGTDSNLYAEGLVMPVFVSADSEEAATGDCNNLFKAIGRKSGSHLLTGEGAGKFPTAGNVIRDLNDIREKHPGFYRADFQPGKIRFGSQTEAFYLRGAFPSELLRDITERITKGGAIITRKISTGTLLKYIDSLCIPYNKLFVARIPSLED